MKRTVGLICLLLIGLSSCVTTPKKLLYLQNMSDTTQVLLEQKYEARIAPSDRLSITVSNCSGYSEEDRKLAEVFNMHTNNNAGFYGNRGGQNGYGGYLVDVYGDIYFPVFGKIHVEGLTRLQLQDTICKMLVDKGYLSKPLVVVEFSNFKINFLGADGGKVIYIDGDRCTLFEALALAGDLGLYTRRDKVCVFREVNGKMTRHTLDPRNSKILNDPYFQLQQNDIIMTESVRGQYYRQEITYWLSWASVLTSVASLVTIFSVLK
ncbi:MAG: polysaccharide biosynthesis/export family protein [Bacteroidales bacterium]|nr:polysaccharide biosynthesis/export family protein [Bacteroidales bacterium]